MDNIKMLMEDLNALESEINKKVDLVKQVILKYNPVDLLTKIEVHKSLRYLGNLEASIHGNISPGIGKSTDIIQSLLVAFTNSSLREDSISKEELQDLTQNIEDLFILNAIYTNTISKDELIKYSQGINTNVSGKLYPFFEEEYFKSLLIPYTKICKSAFGIDGEEVLNGLLNLSNQLRTFSLFEVIDGREDGEEKDFDYSSKIINYFNVEDITKWPPDFIEEFALSCGELHDFYQRPIDIVTKETPIKYKPFFKWSDKFYCFSIDNLMDNFYRSFVKALRRKQPSLSTEINEIQKELSEELPFELLKKILPNATVYKNVFYKAPVGANGKNEWCECDGIILYDDVMIIVEVKAGAISSATPFSDEKGYRESLRDLAEKPYSQSLRLYDEYIKQNKIEIFKKETKKKYRLEKEIEEIKFFQACCVTLDDFNEITAQLERTKLIQSSSLPVWCVSLGDLYVYSEILTSSSHFLNFLYQRSKAAQNPFIKLNDELDHLGMYLEYNDYSISIEELMSDSELNDISEILIESHRDKLNEYMVMKLIEKNKKHEDKLSFHDFLGIDSNKPSQVMNPSFEHLIHLLDTSKEVISTRVSRYLLLFDSPTRDNIGDFLESRRKKLLENRFKKNFYFPAAAFNYEFNNKIEEIPVIMIFLMDSSNKLFKDFIVRRRFLYERVMSLEDYTYCVLVGVNKAGDINKVYVHLIEPKQFRNLNAEVFKQLQESRIKIQKSRGPMNNF